MKKFTIITFFTLLFICEVACKNMFNISNNKSKKTSEKTPNISNNKSKKTSEKN